MQILETYTNRINAHRLIECYYTYKYPTLWMFEDSQIEFELCTFGINDLTRVRIPIGYVYETVKS